MFNYNNRILYSPISYQELKRIPKFTISGIYKIENLINHKVYIGQSKDILYRLKTGHLVIKSEVNPHLRKAFEKYGFDNFSFEIIKQTYDLNYWEVFLIQIYRSTNKKYGYNILPGGKGGDSEVTKQSWRNSEIREKRKLSRELYWSSPEGQRQRQINSERNKSLKQTKGKHWYNNGIEQILTEVCPKGFVAGQLFTRPCTEEAKQKKRDWYANLTEEERISHNRKAAEARKGKPKSDTCKANISKANKGRKYYNNGVIEVMRFECPEGFVPGRCPKKK